MRTPSSGVVRWCGATLWTQASASSGEAALSGAVLQQLRPIAMARTEKTSHDKTLGKRQNTRRAHGSRRHWDSSASAPDLGTPGLRTLHRNLPGGTVSSAT